MSDEEKIDDSYVRHAPAYRSKKFNDFIGRLDQRSAKGSSHPRTKRVEGSPRVIPVPSNIKSWMIQHVIEPSEAHSDLPHESDNEIASASGEESDNSAVY